MNRLIGYAVASAVSAALVGVIYSICTAHSMADFAIKLIGWGFMAWFAYGIWRLKHKDEERQAVEDFKRMKRAEKMRGRA